MLTRSLRMCFKTAEKGPKGEFNSIPNGLGILPFGA